MTRPGEGCAGDNAAVSLRVPPTLAETVELEGPPARREWLAGLAEAVSELGLRWSLEVGAPFEPGGQTAWVAPARDAAGRDLVLKVGWAHYEAEQEADGLRAWRGQGSVLVYDSYEVGQTRALLLEWCRPGTALSRVLPETEQDVVIAGLLARLWDVPPPGPAFRPLDAMCDLWVGEFEARLAAAGSGAPVIDSGLARAGTSLFTDLPRTARRTVLLCTDLHAGNVLSAQREPWLMIDPKPFVGDPCYDVLQHMLNCEDRLAADPAGLARRLADLLQLDGDRVVQWLFARCVLESVHQPELHAVARALAPS